MSAGAPPQTSLGELTALPSSGAPDPLAGFNIRLAHTLCIKNVSFFLPDTAQLQYVEDSEPGQ